VNEQLKLEGKLRAAISHFWSTRQQQSGKQGAKSGTRDTGSRTAVTGGRQMDGFIDLICEYLSASGVRDSQVFCRRRVELPGWYRPEKQWDLLVVAGGELFAGIELKSQVGSFGNNYNNRTEEAIGSATDLWAAYREGAFKPSSRPWLGYMMLLEEDAASLRPIKPQEPHFKVFPEFKQASYAKRYDTLLTKLVRERLYDSACLLLSKEKPDGYYVEPNPELTFSKMLTSLVARATVIVSRRSPT
jgi:hypothetical protein